MSVKQCALTVFVPLLEGQTGPATRALNAIGTKVGKHPELSFQNSPNTHFARFSVVQDARDKEEGRPGRLLFTSNYDGNEDSYLPELCSACGVGLDRIFQFCENYKAGDARDPAKFAQYLRPYQLKPNLFFVSLPGLTVRSIRDSGEIGEIVEDFLDTAPNHSLARLRRAAGILCTRRGRRGWEEELKTILDNRASFLERFIGIEESGSNPNTPVPVPKDIIELEDKHIQNSLVIFATVKDSFRFRLILRLIFLFGHIYFWLFPPWGSLEGVTSIHFARWVICDGGKSVIFESNYDGSWDSYIDHFVDATGPGLNRIWGNCQRFPRLGTKDLDSFKACIRDQQHPANIFYSAYPELTVKNIIANHTLDNAVRAFIRTPDIDRVIAGAYDINE